MIFNLEVYIVTDRKLTGGRDLLEIVEESLQGGAGAIQLREKDISTREFFRLAQKMKELVRKYPGRVFIINDRLDIALAVGADGVHLGQDDLPLPVARRLLPSGSIIGATVSTVAEARKAVEEGADYLGTIAVFGTPTKPDAVPIGLEGVRRIAGNVDIPLVAIGGINRSNAAEVVHAGAEGIAVVSEVMTAQQPSRVVEELVRKVAPARKGED